MQLLKIRIEQALLEEHSRWMLWLPVLLGVGVVVYFAYPQLPAKAPLVLIGGGFSALVFWKRWPWLRALLLAALLIGIGILATQWQQQRLAQPLLYKPTSILSMQATLEEIVDTDDKQKLVLTNIQFSKPVRFEVPHRIRLSLKKRDNRLRAGQRVALRGGLFPLPSPALPGGFDFTNHFYFQGIGAVGFALSPVTILEDLPATSWQTQLYNLRSDVGQKIRHAIEPDFGTATATIAMALINGDKASISEAARHAMMVAGLAHMLSISGLHLSLVTGLFFLLIRNLLVLLFPTLALRFSIKKWAAAVALLGGFAYLALANFPVPAVRSYLMVGLVLLAVMLDRQVMPMRSLAMAAIAVLLCTPAALLGPSFQLSFSATLAIVALYEAWRRHKQQQGEDPERIGALRGGISGVVMRYIAGVLATTLVASTITMPFVIYHFHQFTLYHLLANLAASPIMAFQIMPAALVAMLAMPFGLEHWPLWVMGQGVQWVLELATAIEGLPYSLSHLAAPQPWALLVLIVGFCWLCFWQGRIRHAGWLIMLVATIPFLTARSPDILISEETAQIAVRVMPEQKENLPAYAMLRGSVRNFKAGLWLEALGTDSFAKASALGEDYRCDAEDNCRLRFQNHVIALPKTLASAQDSCAQNAGVDVVIGRFEVEGCAALLVANPPRAVALTFNGETIERREAEAFTERLVKQGESAWPSARQ